MDRERLAWLRVATVAADAAVLAALWAGVVALRAGVGGGLPPLPAEVSLPLGWLVVPMWLAGLAHAGSYAGLRRRGAAELARQAVRGVAVAVLGALLLLFLAGVPVNRTLLLGFAAASVPVLVASRLAEAAALRALRLRRFDPHRVLVVGTADAAAPLVAALERDGGWGVRVVARLSPDEVDAHRLHGIDEVHVAGLPQADALARVARACDAVGVPLSLDANFLGLRTARAELEELDGWTAITFRAASDATPGRLAKRALDVLGALAGLAVLGPALVLAMAAVRWHDGGPALFVQERAGRYGRAFRLYKLRTMVTDAEDRLAGLQLRNEVRGPAFKLRDDPRVTPLGRWLRRLSLDELPQLVNVLRGEMSLVGPRPPLPSEVARYERHQLRRLSVRPGMTGLWQVSGRADLPFERWIELDLEYVDRWSLWLDLRLLARTVPAVLSGTGAR